METSKAQLTPIREGIDLHITTRLYHELGKSSRAKLERALLSDFRNPVDLERWHSASFRNENSIQCSETLGCFYCQKIWTRGAKTIEEWIDCTIAKSVGRRSGTSVEGIQALIAALVMIAPA